MKPLQVRRPARAEGDAERGFFEFRWYGHSFLGCMYCAWDCQNEAEMLQHVLLHINASLPPKPQTERPATARLFDAKGDLIETVPVPVPAQPSENLVIDEAIRQALKEGMGL